MPTLDDAIALAVRAHRGQVDQGGLAHIVHPLGVMLCMSTETEMMVAGHHDVIEDTEYTLEALRQEGYPEEVLVPLDHVTRRQGEGYEALTRRAGEDPVARRVKIADIEDNMDVRRYQRGWRLLTAERWRADREERRAGATGRRSPLRARGDQALPVVPNRSM